MKVAFRFELRFDALPPSKVPVGSRVWYEADGPAPEGFGRYRHARFMPREASRLTLVVRSVRVERLSAITDEDALAEGVRAVTKDGTVTKFCVYDRGDYSSVPWADMPRTARECFVSAFRAMHKLPADADPWLWVVTFGVKT